MDYQSKDSDEEWLKVINSFINEAWLKDIDSDIRSEIINVTKSFNIPQYSRGYEFIDCEVIPKYQGKWYKQSNKQRCIIIQPADI